ncbi:hypothetical protein PtrSN002B_011998 [Pyrenophora tritici-repentis]|uniref:Uncharacterized protein n=1 Tax=Pyrenophora tritici-repentis (strain Pt-1C-BFP) TaxID=426418 RepID=B2W3A3_PYRTR|nr:uncharacterized protein PTRG_04953 [Pyrenophora tritici-repentis Pt-1C-BFP]KAA8611916.1 hypothetical protein PtrV1_13792 [Pyrenophora tritici-repentis]EDU47860.1 conserved hypothetical protein [Pyrenophora tritici-repentis Pt-1C-BFP]KAG9382719.1 hypothetical protein A1F94_006640 [Pyrenophora tritici-repentis]KAI0569287.1 hypothetical protein Alg130_11707 [Pyrenophora tritici-repentis]KAI0570895.1 hypothetical protein Alg215_10764 [Pyrenophora tritici-repentis]
MLGTMLPIACLLFLSALPVHAAFSDFYFAGNNGSSSERRTCPGSSFACEPPNVCAYDDRLTKWYCCDAGAADAVCWGPNVACDGGDRRTPSGSQQVCSSGSNAFCCLKSSEICTERANQVNICWSTLKDPVALLNATVVNETAQSLISARPSAAKYPISLSDLQALSSTTATPSSATPSPSGNPPSSSVAPPVSAAATASSPSSPTSTAQNNGGSGLSSGAIGGIVGGVIGGLALVGIAGLLLWRRKRNSKSNPYEPANAHSPTPYSANHAVEMDANQTYLNAPATEKYGQEVGPMVEVPADRAPAELGPRQ